MVPGKYGVLFEHVNTHDKYFFVVDFDGQNIFQLSFKLNPEAKPLETIEGHYHATILLTLTPFMRSYVACRQTETPLIKAIAEGAIAQYTREGHLDGFNQDLSASNLNPSQKNAVASFTQLPEGIQLLMGPPGTGKTTTITRTIATLIQNDLSSSKPILVCGSSNKSVQVIAAALQKKFPQIKVALYTQESQLDPATKDALKILISWTAA